MLRITSKIDIRELGSSLAQFERDQVPFAAAVALTQIAKNARAEVQKTIPERFEDRGGSGQFLKHGVRFERATKTNLEAAVTDIDWQMADQETGGARTPLGAGMMTVPVDEALRKVPFRPSQAELAARARSFITTLPNGREAIVRRQGRDRYPLAVEAVLVPVVQEHPRFGMRETVERTVHDQFATEFALAMRRAVDTRK